MNTYKRTSKQKVTSVYPLAELRYKNDLYYIVDNGYGSVLDALIIGRATTPLGAWKKANQYVEANY